MSIPSSQSVLVFRVSIVIKRLLGICQILNANKTCYFSFIGTVQNHINFLEDHILGLEDDIEKRDIEIKGLQEKLQVN